MSNMLQFKMGQFAGLANQGIAPGTVYVTTDEQALYVDIPANGEQAAKRIRMGDVIQVKDVAELLSFAPDYNTNALYYVIDKNALMKYTGDGTTHKWQQINSVEGVTTELNALATRVGTAESNITALNTSLGANNDQANTTTAFGRIKALEGKMTTAEGEIDALQSLTAEQKTDIENLQAAVGEGAEGLASKVNVLETKMDDVEGDIDDINATIGTVDDAATANTIYGAIAKAEANAISTAAIDATNKADSALASAKTYADQAEADALTAANTYTDDEIIKVNNAIDAINATIGDAEDTGTEDTVYGAIAAAKVHAETKATAAKNEAIDTAATDATNKAKDALEDAKDYTDTEIGKVYGTIGTVESGKTVVDMITDAKTATTKALAEAKNYADQAELDAIATAAADATTKAGAAEANAKGYTDTEVGKVNARIGDAEDTATEGTVYGAIAKAKADAKAYTDEKLQAADAMTFRGVLGGEGNLESLPAAAEVQAGDTYKIGVEDNNGYGTGHKVKVGDLLIALEDGKSNYAHITSGYEDDYDSRLGVDAEESKVILRNAMRQAKGSVQFVGDGNNGSVKVEVTGTENPTTGQADSQVTISLQWGSF